MLGKLKKLVFGLPPHPYEDQFSTKLDKTEVKWPTRFVLIASTPRCGSHYLGHILMDQGNYGVPLEYLNNGNFAYWLRKTKTKTHEDAFRATVKLRTSPNGTFCFKAHWHQFESYSQNVDEVTENLGISSVIWIYRRNLLKQAISLAVAEQTHAWISGAPEIYPATYNYSHIMDAATRLTAENQAWHEYLSQNLPNSVITICYEDLLDPQKDELKRLSLALKCDPELVPTQRTVKQSNSRNSEWLELFKSEITAKDKWVLQPVAWRLTPE